MVDKPVHKNQGSRQANDHGLFEHQTSDNMDNQHSNSLTVNLLTGGLKVAFADETMEQQPPLRTRTKVSMAPTNANETTTWFSHRRAEDDKARINTPCLEENVDFGTIRGCDGNKSEVSDRKNKLGLSASLPGPRQCCKGSRVLSSLSPVGPLYIIKHPLNTIDSSEGSERGTCVNTSSRPRSDIKMKLRAQSATSISANRQQCLETRTNSASSGQIYQDVTKCQTHVAVRGGKIPVAAAPILSRALGRLRQQSARRRRGRLSPAEGRREIRRAQSAGPAFNRFTLQETMKDSQLKNGSNSPRFQTATQGGNVTSEVP